MPTGANTREIKLCEFNVENLFVSMEYFDGHDLERLTEKEWRALSLPQFKRRQKPLHKLWGLSQAIQDIDPDILMLIEVGGRDSLENFNRHFLQSRYTPYFVEGNSRRAIDLGYLVKKDLPFRVEALSNKETPIEVLGPTGKVVSKFSRDIAELRIHDGEALQLILLLIHLKSKISVEGDPEGRRTRTAEAIALAEFYGKRREEFPEVPVVVAGDFNAEFGSLELELLRHSDLTDYQDLIEAPPEDRATFVYFDHSNKRREMVLDYFLVSPQLRTGVVKSQSFTYRYKASPDVVEPTPSSLSEKFRMPSDHYPLVLTLKLE